MSRYEDHHHHPKPPTDFPFDHNVQATLDRLTTALDKLEKTIGKTLMSAISDLEAAATALATANSDLGVVITEAVSEVPLLATRITDLVAQLAAAVAAGGSVNDPQIATVVGQLTTAAGALTSESQALKAAADAASTVLTPPDVPVVPTV